MRYLSILIVGWLLSPCPAQLLAHPQVKNQVDTQPIDFSHEIQPILSENCYYCHGQDEEQRQAGLRLDDNESTLDYVTPGDSTDSELIRRILTDDPDELMPPPDSNRKLSKQQIEKLKRWVDEGAVWGKHWAFDKIEKPEVHPQVHPIDAFVQRKLKTKGWQLSPEADRRTLIRRVSLDLTGLPPTVEAVQRFVTDERPDAYERMVDTYLNSPAYGERMAWVWLDAARYADSNGYQGDNERTMWPWRDWVVNAYNENMPFDQFSTWQLAGDLLPKATDEQVLATGFLRNHPINGEGGRIAEENRIDYVMDMTETTGTVWLGLTFNCCRCHDHKYDRLTQNDYYSMFAYFNQTPINGGGGNAQTPPVLPVPSSKQKRELTDLNEQLAEVVQNIENRVAELSKENAGENPWQPSTKSSWEVLKVVAAEAGKAELKVQKDQSIFSEGELPKKDNYEIEYELGQRKITGVRMEVLTDPRLPKGGVGRSNSSNFVLTDFELTLKVPDQPDQAIKILSAESDFAQSGFDIKFTFDDNPSSGWAVLTNGKRYPHQAVFALEKAIKIPPQARLGVKMKHQSKHEGHLVGRFRLSATSHPQPKLSILPYNVRVVLDKPEDKRTENDRKLLSNYQWMRDKKHQQLTAKKNKLQQRRNEIDRQIPKVMVMRDRPNRRKTFRLERGSYEAPKDEVNARTPEAFSFGSSPKADAPANRLALARWLFDQDNPLTARVASNRLWAMLFGTGLVKTTEDFGVQGEPPSHPELLDWLAAEYRDSGWDTKHLLRSMMLSKTYRQSSRHPAHAKEDPDNRYLSRASRFRMPSWMIRDAALASAGQLAPRLGGRPVNSYQPAGVWEEASFGKKKFKLGQGDDLYRRTLYTFWRRIAPPTMLFDNADRMTCSVGKYLTNTPLQALVTLNDVTFVEAARMLATSVYLASEDDRVRINGMYLRVLSRPAREKEVEVLLRGLQRTRAQFAKQPDAARELIANGESEPDRSIDAVELASWTSVGLAIFNLDESLTRQ